MLLVNEFIIVILFSNVVVVCEKKLVIK